MKYRTVTFDVLEKLTEPSVSTIIAGIISKKFNKKQLLYKADYPNLYELCLLTMDGFNQPPAWNTEFINNVFNTYNHRELVEMNKSAGKATNTHKSYLKSGNLTKAVSVVKDLNIAAILHFTR